MEFAYPPEFRARWWVRAILWSDRPWRVLAWLTGEERMMQVALWCCELGLYTGGKR